MHVTSKPPRRKIFGPHLMVALLAVSSLARCSCEEEVFTPGARYNPPEVLDFGFVSVASEKTLTIEVQSNGSAALSIVDALVDGDTTKFSVAVSPDLVDGVAPGRTSSVSVTYRPCPDAWNGNTLKDQFDFTTGCTGAPDSADLSITDNTPEGSVTITLSGQPVQPPVATVLCPVGVACGDMDPNFTECNGMNFGTVNSGEEPCDLLLEIQNSWRNDAPVGTLEIESMEVLVRNLDDNGALLSADEAGFQILNVDGSPLTPDSGNPFAVDIESGNNEGSQQFILRFTGATTGLLRGEAATMTGLRLITNDPDQPIITAPITAVGSAPDLVIQIDKIVNYGPVEQGLTRTATRTLTNFGNATLTIDSMESTSPEFTFTTVPAGSFPRMLQPNESFQLFIDYTPADTGVDIEAIQISSNDPDELAPPTGEGPEANWITLRGGAVPTIEVEPANSLVFSLPNPPPPPPAPAREECLTIRNVGFGDLVIDEFELRGPPSMMDGPTGSRDHPSVDDFTISTPSSCSGQNPCDPGITLCPPTDPGCTDSTTQVCFEYLNTDISMTDRVNLFIRSNDPANAEVTVVLDANDNPCLFPIPQITVLTQRPCVGQPVMITAQDSDPGGVAGGNSMITSYDWSFIFAPPPVPVFMPQGAEDTLFIPERGGVYILGLDITNDCGRTSQSKAMETINVADTGCN